MKITFSILLFLGTSFLLMGQQYVIPLWEDGTIPNSKETGGQEDTLIWDDILFINTIQEPSIAVYLPSKGLATGEAVLLFPGGGYHNLAYYWEGRDIAKALNAKGIAAIVVKYRLPNADNHIIQYKSPLLDAQRSIRIVRSKAKQWNIDSTKIGIMGFSAGGHLAATLTTHYDNGNLNSKDSVEQQTCRPDFSVLVYPVISMKKGLTHKGSRLGLLGAHPSQELIDNFSNELQVTMDTPPCFLLHASDDDVVPVKNSLLFYEALQKNKVSCEMHIYPQGGHGFSLATNKGRLSNWISECTSWIHYITQ